MHSKITAFKNRLCMPLPRALGLFLNHGESVRSPATLAITNVRGNPRILRAAAVEPSSAKIYLNFSIWELGAGSCRRCHNDTTNSQLA
ncbi:MAG: hypothetical protein QOD56_818 [Gammaproteobacteria bacterium]|jgi:hypothetical protein|nr:hypothetical protein [Gammaproteobacteria bacterium]